MKMDKERYGRAKACLVSCMQEGYSWQAAKAVAGLQISQSNAYRLWRAFRQRGETALSDGRHGHPSKLRGAARALLEEQCGQAPQTPSSTIQALLQERFDLRVSISQINRVRAALGISNHRKSQQRGKKDRRGKLFPSTRVAGERRQSPVACCSSSNRAPHGASIGPRANPAHCGSGAASCSHSTGNPARQLLTLLFLQAVGLRRTWDLRGYSGQALALLTSRRLAYSYRHIERFLAELAKTGADEVLTHALAGWTAALWKRQPTLEDSPVPVYYIDGHRKAVSSDSLIPRGLVGRLEKVLGCRALVVLHDQEGHPLLVTTPRGDQHLTIGLPAILTSYEQAAGLQCVERLVVDREGMAAEFLAALANEGRTVVTVLRTDQYSGLESFREVGEFVPWRVDRQGKVIREVALAHFSLSLPEHPGQNLDVRIALIRDLSLCWLLPSKVARKVR